MQKSKILNIIVPYRDRPDHLEYFVPYMNDYLKQEGIEFSITVVDQDDELLFNRAKLLNAGFLETNENNDYTAFHDIDMVPKKPNAGYHYTETARQVFCPTEYSMGGISIVNNTVNWQVNGWANSYWGWGGEDRNYKHRLAHHGIALEESKGFRKWAWGKDHFKELSGNHDPERKQHKKKQAKLTKRFKEFPEKNNFDGLANCNYEVTFNVTRDGYNHIGVDLRE